MRNKRKGTMYISNTEFQKCEAAGYNYLTV